MTRIVINPGDLAATAALMRNAAGEYHAIGARVASCDCGCMPPDVAATVESVTSAIRSRLNGIATEAAAEASDLRARAGISQDGDLTTAVSGAWGGPATDHVALVGGGGFAGASLAGAGAITIGGSSPQEFNLGGGGGGTMVVGGGDWGGLFGGGGGGTVSVGGDDWGGLFGGGGGGGMVVGGDDWGGLFGGSGTVGTMTLGGPSDLDFSRPSGNQLLLQSLYSLTAWNQQRQLQLRAEMEALRPRFAGDWLSMQAWNNAMRTLERAEHIGSSATYLDRSHFGTDTDYERYNFPDDLRRW